MPGKIFTLTGSSGAGKTTVMGGLIKVLPNFDLISSHTRRKKRESDLPREYIYYDNDREFEKMRDENPTLWDAEVRGFKYCTTEISVAETKNHPGKIFGMVLIPSVIELLKEYAQPKNIEVTSTYIISPPEHILRQRLRDRIDKELRSKCSNNDIDARRKEAYEQIEKDIAECKRWDDNARRNAHLYEHFIRNEGFIEETVQKVINILKKP